MCGIPDTDNAEIQSPSLARDSSNQKQESPKDSNGGLFSKIGATLKLLFLKVFFFLAFSLDRINIGCPLIRPLIPSQMQ